MSAAANTIVALGDVGVHVLQDGQQGVRPTAVKTVILTAAQAIPADSVPEYVLEDVKAGRAPRLKLVTEQQAKDFAHAVALDKPSSLAEAEALAFKPEEPETEEVEETDAVKTPAPVRYAEIENDEIAGIQTVDGKPIFGSASAS